MTPSQPSTDTGERADLARPKPQPLREPRPICSTEKDFQAKPPQLPGSHPAFEVGEDEVEENAAAEPKRRKHESYNLSGSVFLITGDGRTLNLPIPSDNRHDPLGWGRWKKTGAFFALIIYSVTALTVVQAVSLMMPGINTDFSDEVGFLFCPHHSHLLFELNNCLG